jgi:hypothetical protein
MAAVRLMALADPFVQEPTASTMPAMCPSRGDRLQALGGCAALAAIGVIASRLPATRIRPAQRPHRLWVFFIAPPFWPDITVCMPTRTVRYWLNPHYGPKKHKQRRNLTY